MAGQHHQLNGHAAAAATAAKSLQSCPSLCGPIDGSSPGSRPWDSPGKNTGVGCHFLLQCMKVKSESEVAQSCLTLCNPQEVDSGTTGSSVVHCFPEFLKFLSIESVMPLKRLILCHLLLLLPSVFSSIRVFSDESALCIRWPKY